MIFTIFICLVISTYVLTKLEKVAPHIQHKNKDNNMDENDVGYIEYQRVQSNSYNDNNNNIDDIDDTHHDDINNIYDPYDANQSIYILMDENDYPDGTYDLVEENDIKFIDNEDHGIEMNIFNKDPGQFTDNFIAFLKPVLIVITFKFINIRVSDGEFFMSVNTVLQFFHNGCVPGKMREWISIEAADGSS